MLVYDRVKKYIDENNMIEYENSVIVGVSGGADSVCLLHIIKRYIEEQDGKIDRITAVHIHHGIRGEEADRDMEFTKKLCENLGIRIEIRHFNVPEYAKKNGMSEEEAGRILRYKTFQEIGSKISAKGNTKIAVAHNLNDNAETVIHNLCRGTGLKGLAGIPNMNGHIIRPLLCIERKDIEGYLLENNIKYINDSTNFNSEYTRNKIRLSILPYLEENINKKSICHIANAAENVNEAESFLEKITLETYKLVTYVDNNCVYIRKSEMKNVDTYIQKRIIRLAIFELVNKLKDITNTHINDILKLFENTTGKSVNLPYSIIAQSGYENIVIGIDDKKTKDKSDSYTIIDKAGEYALEGKNETFKVEFIKVDDNLENIKNLVNNIKNIQNMYTKWFDYDKIKFIVQLRYRRQGDYLVVDQNMSTKKLKSYFIDNKIPKDERDTIPLLTDGSHIMWIVGKRISEEYKVTLETKNILKITMS